jgi:hypothetical protein
MLDQRLESLAVLSLGEKRSVFTAPDNHMEDRAPDMDSILTSHPWHSDAALGDPMALARQRIAYSVTTLAVQHHCVVSITDDAPSSNTLTPSNIASNLHFASHTTVPALCASKILAPHNRPRDRRFLSITAPLISFRSPRGGRRVAPPRKSLTRLDFDTYSGPLQILIRNAS